MVDRRMPAFSPSRAERLAAVGSPVSQGALATILAGAQLVTDFEGGRFEQYLPFNRLTITNNTDVRLTVVAGSFTFTVLAREGQTTPKGLAWYRQFRVTNEDGAAATGANAVFFIAEREPVDADTAARMRVLSGRG